jgi:hypothetical protein
MKMVKKCIFALALVALLVSVAPAEISPGSGTTAGSDNQPANVVKRDGDWPWTYKAIDLCVMPVYMDVGHYVQLEKCGDRKIELKQVACETIGKNVGDHFPCYSDCEAFKVRANFKAIFGGELKNKLGWIKDTKVWWKDDINQIQGTGGWETLNVCVDMWKAEIWNSGAQDHKMKVADLHITVKPPDGGAP